MRFILSFAQLRLFPHAPKMLFVVYFSRPPSVKLEVSILL